MKSGILKTNQMIISFISSMERAVTIKWIVISIILKRRIAKVNSSGYHQCLNWELSENLRK